MDQQPFTFISQKYKMMFFYQGVKILIINFMFKQPYYMK